MTADSQTRQRDLLASGLLLLITPVVAFGLVLPSHDYAGSGGALEGMVTSDALLVSTMLAAFSLIVAIAPILLRPRKVVLPMAVAILLVATWNLGRCLSYYWFESELIHRYG